MPADQGPEVRGTGGIVDGEFADVAVMVDTAANGPRLRLEDRRTGRVRWTHSSSRPSYGCPTGT